MRLPDLEIGPTLRAISNARAAFVMLMLEVAFGLAVVVNVFLLGDWLRRGTNDDLGMSLDRSLFAVTRPRGTVDPEQGRLDLAALRTLPGIQAAALLTDLPLMRWRLPEVAAVGPQRALGWILGAGDGVAAALGVSLSAGRDLTAADVAQVTTRPRVLITAALARRLFGRADAIGRTMSTTHYPELEVVGVLSHFSAMPSLAPHADQVVILATEPPLSPAHFVLQVRPGARVGDTHAAALRALQIAMPGRMVTVRSLRAERTDFTRTARGGAWVFAFIIVVVLEIALIGSLAMSSFLVAERTRQIGIRRALGARRRDIVRYFLVENWLVTTTGLLIGVALTFAINWLVRQAAPEVVPEWRYFVLGAIAFWITGLGAALVPALRAANTAPTVASRTV